VRLVGVRSGQRHLVRPERALDLLTVDHRRAGPALWGAHHDHRPGPPDDVAVGRAGCLLDVGDLVQAVLHRLGHRLVHRRRVAAGDEAGRVAVAAHQLLQLGLRNPGEDRRVGDLVLVQGQDR